MIKAVTLEGATVRLEPMIAHHAPGLLESAKNERIWDFMSAPQPKSLADMEKLVAEALDERQSGVGQPFVIIHRQSGAIAGSTRCYDFRPAHRAMEIGWTWVGAPWQRTAVNTEAKLLLLTHGFEAMELVRIQLKTDGRNLRSRQAIERLGATREGTLRKHMRLWNGYTRDTVFYSILAEEWPQVKERLRGFLKR